MTVSELVIPLVQLNKSARKEEWISTDDSEAGNIGGYDIIALATED
ncbi:hypothetical protein WH5701_03199 [Synechococcus sp. WH 5701]|nr:hypothetical protein WH5701_03199 [Synechococcus sp. WH 5701]